MVRKKDPIITAFQKSVRKSFPKTKIILFGSRAKNKFRKDSDYDFLLVSPKFTKLEWEKRTAKVYSLKRNIPASMDILCYTPEEFERKKKLIGIVRQAVEEGIEIK